MLMDVSEIGNFFFDIERYIFSFKLCIKTLSKSYIEKKN